MTTYSIDTPDAGRVTYQDHKRGYCYDEAKGDDHEGYPPGFAFTELPADFVCPDCSVRYKEDFSVVVEQVP
jgi:rubredoxin